MKVLVLVGSLRADSFNAHLADAAAAALPAGARVTVFDRLAELPFYSEDADASGTFPPVVAEFRSAVADADALIVATPEYNGSISAVLKNAIDIASRPRGASALAGKPAAVLAASVSPRGGLWAREALTRILTVAGAEPLEDTVGLGDAFGHRVDGVFVVPEHTREELRALIGQLTHVASAA